MRNKITLDLSPPALGVRRSFHPLLYSPQFESYTELRRPKQASANSYGKTGRQCQGCKVHAAPGVWSWGVTPPLDGSQLSSSSLPAPPASSYCLWFFSFS